ncbi:MAG: hydrogenase maturation protease [Thermoplasmata archaeon]|nr:hydrogenase maturation protease [Thermoplasmata archaeon]
MRTLVLGIGNPIMGDDGVGFHVVKELAKEIKDENIDVKDTSADGLNLLELIIGYDKLIVIDAIVTEGEKVGRIYRLKPEDVCEPLRSVISSHHFNLTTTLEIGKRLFPEDIPKEITVFAVGIQEVSKVTEEMTVKVKEAIPRVVDLILEEISSG